MGVCNTGFELGSDQATITTSDPPDGDAWSLVSVPSGGTLIYDSTRAALGAQSCKLATVAAGVCILRWNDTSALGTLPDHYGRIYLYFTAIPAASTIVARASNGAATTASVRVNTATGFLALLDSGNTQVGVGTVAIATGQWIRVEWRFVHSATVGMLEAKLFNTATSAVADDTITTAANKNTGTQTTWMTFGNVTSLANVGPFWMDQIQAGAAAYPGVAPVGKPSGMLLGVG